MFRRIAVVVFALAGLGVASHQALACMPMGSHGMTADCCAAADQCRTGNGLLGLACSPAACAAALNLAPQIAAPTMPSAEALQFTSIDLPRPPFSLGASSDAALAQQSTSWANSLTPPRFSAAPAPYLATLRLRL